MERKRKKEIVSPVVSPDDQQQLSQSKKKSRTKKSKMAQKGVSPTQGTVNSTANGMNSLYQNTQQFSLPAMYSQYQYPMVGMLNPGSPVLSQNSQNGQNSMLYNDQSSAVMQKLDQIEKQLGQLGEIKSIVHDLTVRMSDMSKKINDIEKSQQFISDQYETISKCTNSNKQSISDLEANFKRLTVENESLKEVSKTLQENVTDLKCRSMRDNLLFFGIPEGPVADFLLPLSQTEINAPGLATSSTSQPPVSTDESIEPDPSETDTSEIDAASATSSPNRPIITSDDCKEKVFRFCEDVLKIKNPKNCIKIIRAHRIGKFNRSKTRPIVAKFDEDSKPLIKEYLKGVNLRPTPYNVADQYPQEVQQRRKELIPAMQEARRKGKRANLIRDKLFINDVEYVPESAPAFGWSDK